MKLCVWRAIQISLYEVIIFINLCGLQLWDRNCSEDDRKEAKQHDEYAIGTYLEANTGSEPGANGINTRITLVHLGAYPRLRA